MLGVMNAATALPLKSDLAASELRTQLEARRADGVIVARDTDTPAREIAAGLGLPVLEPPQRRRPTLGAPPIK